jgi:hypothetical protein
LQKKHLKKNLHNISEKKKYNEDFYYYPWQLSISGRYFEEDYWFRIGEGDFSF